mmetsp:Transcript_6114/g.22452  ORF Transcript_6114/g.22452 Transcript_6114/m.22452 type:complete len:200 (+) Transcript_6114:1759-2358(+)
MLLLWRRRLALRTTAAAAAAPPARCAARRERKKAKAKRSAGSGGGQGGPLRRLRLLLQQRHGLVEGGAGHGALVARELDAPQQLLVHVPVVPRLAHEGGERLALGPALLARHLRQVGRAAARAARRAAEGDRDAVHSDLPRHAVRSVLEVGEQRDGAGEAAHLPARDGREALVAQRAGERVLAQPLVQRLRAEGADAAA